MEIDLPDDRVLIQELETEPAMSENESSRDVSDEEGGGRQAATGTESTMANKSRTRERLGEVLHSSKAQYCIIALVVLDCVIVIAELLIDLTLIPVDHDNPAPHVLHYISIGILCIFLIEIVLKIYAMGLEFFKHKLEVFDALVVIVSFSLDVAFSNESGAMDAISMLILLRLWRVTRIVNGIVMSVKIQAEKKISALEKENKQLKEDLVNVRERCSELERELQSLEQKST